MHRLILIMVLFIMFCSFGIDDFIWKLPSERFKGKVKSCRQEVFFIEDEIDDSFKLGKIPFTKIKDNFLKTFNKEGEILSEVIFNIDSSIRLTTNYEYENFSNFLFKEKRTELVNSELKSIMLLTYNKNHDILYYKIYDGKNRLQRISEFKYIGKKIIKEIEYAQNKSISGTYDFFYNSSVLDSIISFDSKGIVFRKWIFTKVGNKLDIKGFGGDGLLLERKYHKEFYPEGELKSIEFININDSGEDGLIREYTFDKNGNVLTYNEKIQDFHSMKQVTKFLKLDTNGNWTEKVIIENGNPAYYYKRDITYFE